MSERAMGRCVALNSAGRRCRAAAVTMTRYHGDGESYSAFDETAVRWVAAPFCYRHAERWRSLKEFQRRERAKRRANAD
jgi:hypothetical protein